MITRAEWGARSAQHTAIGDVRGWAMHWEGPGMGVFPHERCAGKVLGIQRFHMDVRLWSDIAYNFVVCPHGYVFEGRGDGARSAANGTNEANEHYLAVCYLGGEGDVFTIEAQEAIDDLVGNARLEPHSNFFQTSCPGDVIREWLHVRESEMLNPVYYAQEEDEEMANDAARTVRWSSGPVAVLYAREDGNTEHYGAVPQYGNMSSLLASEKQGFEKVTAAAWVIPNDPRAGYILYNQKGQAFVFTSEFAATLRNRGTLR